MAAHPEIVVSLKRTGARRLPPSRVRAPTICGVIAVVLLVGAPAITLSGYQSLWSSPSPLRVAGSSGQMQGANSLL